jgi:3-dehydroshikimate dehydratase
MKISAVSWSVHSLIKSGKINLEGFIELCKSYRLDGVELFDAHVSGTAKDERFKHLEKIKNVIKRSDLKIAAYMASNDFTNESAHEENLVKVRNIIEEAKFLGADKIRILGGAIWELNGRKREDAFSDVIKGLKKAVKLAEENSVQFVLENHGDLPGLSSEVLEVLDAVKSPNLKVCCDIGNFIAGNMHIKENPYDGLKAMLPHVTHVHIKDRRFAPGVPGDTAKCIIGTGNVPLEKCLALLKQSGYSGFLSCECEGEEGICNETAFMNSVANVKTAVEKCCK